MSLQRRSDELAAPEPDPLREATWLYSYADLITQLLLFTILSVTVVGMKDMKKSQPASAPSQASQQLDEAARQLNEIAQQQGLQQLMAIDRSADRVTIRLKSALLFAEGRADLQQRARELLQEISRVLQAAARNIRVEGHTDDVPIHNAAFASNWELSTSRAISVVQYLEQHGIDRGRLSAAGYGEHHPIAANDGESNRALNRRVEIVMLGQ